MAMKFAVNHGISLLQSLYMVGNNTGIIFRFTGYLANFPNTPNPQWSINKFMSYVATPSGGNFGVGSNIHSSFFFSNTTYNSANDYGVTDAAIGNLTSNTASLPFNGVILLGLPNFFVSASPCQVTGVTGDDLNLINITTGAAPSGFSAVFQAWVIPYGAGSTPSALKDGNGDPLLVTVNSSTGALANTVTGLPVSAAGLVAPCLVIPSRLPYVNTPPFNRYCLLYDNFTSDLITANDTRPIAFSLQLGDQGSTLP